MIGDKQQSSSKKFHRNKDNLSLDKGRPKTSCKMKFLLPWSTINNNKVTRSGAATIVSILNVLGCFIILLTK
jgi:hypothetical protein